MPSSSETLLDCLVYCEEFNSYQYFSRRSLDGLAQREDCRYANYYISNFIKSRHQYNNIIFFSELGDLGSAGQYGSQIAQVPPIRGPSGIAQMGPI